MVERRWVEVNKIRAAIADWEGGVGYVSGPRPDGQLSSIVEVMLTSGGALRPLKSWAIERRGAEGRRLPT